MSNSSQYKMSNTSFHFRHSFLLSAHSSQSHTTSYLSLMPHDWVNNKCKWSKRLTLKMANYAINNFLLPNSVTSFQKQPPLFFKVSQISQENTCFKKLQAYFMFVFLCTQ